MKLIIFILTSIVSTSLFAQEKQADSQATSFKKIQIGVNFSPDYCYRTLKNNDGSSTSEALINIENERETARLGYTTGLNFIYNFKQNIGLEFGVQYSNKGYQIKSTDLVFGDMIDPTNGFVYIPQPPNTNFKYNYNYFEIPLRANFIFGNRKLRFITSAGFATNFFIKETITSIYEYNDGTKDKQKRQTSNLTNKINISPILSLGIDWKLNDRSNLRIEPTFRYGILKINDYPVTGYLWNAGLNIGYYFGIK